jgi:exodeoxyribonuclease V alpha subunit
MEQELVVELDDGRVVRYLFASLDELTHVYAMSIHKAQGAEFPAVVNPLLTNHAAILGRTLLYTSVTRAKHVVVIVGQRQALQLAVRDWRRTPRHTALAGVLDGTLRFDCYWPKGRGAVEVEAEWEGLVAGSVVVPSDFE